MPNPLSRLAYALNDLMPGAKRRLPKPLVRFVLLRLAGAQRGFPDESRRVLEQEILPGLARRYAKILFVGTGSYTYWYERLFRPDQFTTIDSNPAHPVWGAADNITAPIQEIGRHRSKGSFDCVVLNGVIGFGVNDPESMRATAKALHEVMKANAQLLVGWNTDISADPDALGIFAPYFRRTAEPRRTFSGETHVYDFYERLPD